MGLILIDLERVLVDALQREVSARGMAGNVVTPFPTIEDAKRTFARATLAVFPHRLWPQWTKIPEGDRPPAYLICGDHLSTIALEEISGLGVMGFAPASVPALLADVVDSYQRLARPSEEPGLQIGSMVNLPERVETGPAARADALLVGWGIGPGGEARRAIHSLVQRSRSLRQGNPFKRVSAGEWLDLYSWYRFGAVLDSRPEDEEKRFFKRTDIKSGAQLIEQFQEWFVRPAGEPSLGPILVLGETGTGKTIVARKLHAALVTRTGQGPLPFHHVNCSALGEMADVELFGAMRGAYTSADVTNPGKVLASYGGTLFLDEFGALDAAAQAKLLLFLEDGTVTPMGWVGDPIRVPIQVIAGTNEFLTDRVARREFRADLFYRFREKIALPPLRKVKAWDLPYLVDYVMQQEAVNPGQAIRSVSGEAMKKLGTHNYPGNFRELGAILGQAVRSAALANVDAITTLDIAFGASTLARQDSVVALATRDQRLGKEVLLLWNPHWKRYFLPGGRLEAGESPETCVRREVRAKLGLGEEDFTLAAIPGIGEISTIQYSARDGQLKTYCFRAYHVHLLASTDDRPDVQWLSLDTSRWPLVLAEEHISETLRELGGFFDALKRSTVR